MNVYDIFQITKFGSILYIMIALFYGVGKLVCADYYYYINDKIEDIIDDIDPDLLFVVAVGFHIFGALIMFISVCIGDKVWMYTLNSLFIMDSCIVLYFVIHVFLTNIHLYFRKKRGR